MILLTILAVVLGWVVIGLLTGVLMDKYKKEDTVLWELFMYAGLGPILTIMVGFFLFMERFDWNKPIIKNEKDDETKSN